MENLPSRTTEPTQLVQAAAQVQEFVSGYTLSQEMGFSSSSVVEALVTYDNGTEKALAHFLDGSSWCYLMILEIVYCGRDLSFSVCIFLLYSLLSMMRFVEIQVGINIPHMKKDLMVKKISNGWEVVV